MQFKSWLEAQLILEKSLNESNKQQKINELGSIALQYNGKHYVVELPNNADAPLIRQIIKGKTGVEGAFYMHFGDQLTNYLHCSSITRGNLAKLVGGYGKFWKKSIRFVT